MDNFQRDICFKLSRNADNDIVVTNILQDTYYDILLVVVVDNENLQIRDIRVEFRKSPTPHCPGIEPRLMELTGQYIGRGLTKKLLSTLSGGQGCINIRNMLLSSLPLVLNMKAAEEAKGEREVLDKIHDVLRGTCVGWSDEQAQ